jgi:hypothetical protein
MIPKTKEERLEVVNKIIREIASRGRKFFYSKTKDRYAEMVIEKGKVYFIDDYTGERVYAYNTVQNAHRNFSHGGTLWGLINDFREFIVKGEYTNHNNGYGGLYSPHWGYPKEDMQAIINLAKDLGYLES